jgi:hypothetical protein
MKNLNKVKILIVGLTTVLALLNFKNNNLKKGFVRNEDSNLNTGIFQNYFIHNTI